MNQKARNIRGRNKKINSTTRKIQSSKHAVRRPTVGGKDEGARRIRPAGRRPSRKNRKRKNGLSTAVLLFALIVFVVSGIQLIRTILPYFQGGAEYDNIKELALLEADSGETDENYFVVDFDRLKEINPDTVAWLRFDEPAVISYPVVQTTNNSDYLTKTFEANDNKLGTIFVDCENKADFTDRNTFLYGHNLKVGGEMFSQLLSYQDEEFYKKYPYFYIYTPDGKMRTYQIFSAGEVKATAQNYVKEYNTDAEFEEYLKLAKSSSDYDTGVEVSVNSTIVSLSTCTNVRDDERFLVQGLLIDEKYINRE